MSKVLAPALNRDSKNWMYPAIEPYETGFLDVTNGHKIYFEQSGNPHGKPAVFVHGGPGGGTDPQHRRFFDPRVYRIILFDQRGCGKSKPHASLEHNTTWDLVNDMEQLRRHLKIDKWQVFGGSWGSTLALVYAEHHPERVSELVLRGIFLVRKKEIDWFYQNGTSEIFPDAWEKYLNHIPESERSNMVAAYYKRLTSPEPKVRLAAAKVWSVWEGTTSYLYTNIEDAEAKFGADEFALAFARIECHYFMNHCFLPSPNYILENAHKLSAIPATIVQGRYDVVCPMASAWELKKAMPHADLLITPDAGHSAFEPGNCRALVAATDKYSGS